LAFFQLGRQDSDLLDKIRIQGGIIHLSFSHIESFRSFLTVISLLPLS
jgi:hypothetical protein